jgi:spore maturation protein A
MLNYLWAGMILIGIVFGAFQGKMPEITNAALDSAKDAVTLCITMMGIMSFWVGMMEIATRAGIIEMASKKMRPLIRFLFPNIPEGHKAADHITINFIANFLGLGWAATPAGLEAMKSLAELEESRREEEKRGIPTTRGKRKRIKAMPKGVASNEMCIFLILNISSLQLIPVNVIAYRSQYGSLNPSAIVGPGILATAISTVIAIIFCKFMDLKRNI